MYWVAHRDLFALIRRTDRGLVWLYAASRPQLLWARLDDRQRRAGLALNLSPAWSTCSPS
ncbi:MAG TPA: hypothetical protein VG693_03645 [Actinomycetes bacterium]|jgi:hypothetical protein|nr:hypothetical protein [Actinomycetes bacterium]HEV3505626.1 hypothetical protein [Actinomycetes bacterium]